MSEPSEGVVRVSTLELFFDLVFVFTITQLTAVLAHEWSWRGLAQVMLMLGVIFWMYGGYAWLTNAVAPDRAERRALLLGGMAGFLIVALAVPRAFEGTGTAFGIAYVAIVSIHWGLFAKGTQARSFRAVLSLAPFNLTTALLVLAGGIAGGTAQYALWAAACAIEWVTPQLSGIEGFEIAPAHFVERHGLVVLIAIGESIVAIGIGAAELPLNLELACVALLGLTLSACLWWIYFRGDDTLAERALASAPPERRPQLAIDAFGYCHVGLLLGVIAIAAAEKEVTAHPFDDLAFAKAAGLAGGLALFLVSDVLFRRTLAIGPGGWRTAAALLALATIPLGLAVAAVAQLAVLVLVLGAALLAEGAHAARPAVAI